MAATEWGIVGTLESIGDSGMPSVLPYPRVGGLGRPEQPKKGGATKCSDLYGRKVCITPPGNEHRTAEVLAEGKGNIE